MLKIELNTDKTGVQLYTGTSKTHWQDLTLLYNSGRTFTDRTYEGLVVSRANTSTTVSAIFSDYC